MRSRVFLFFASMFITAGLAAQTTALWLFDEQAGVYPSAVLNDASENDFPLVIGPGGMLVPGKFGNALDAVDQPEIVVPGGEREFGLEKVPVPEGRTVEPITWFNAHFCALMTGGENHIRNEVGFRRPTHSKLNLGDFDWTVEFWYRGMREPDNDGVVFETGTGPRGENSKITALLLNADLQGFTLINAPSGSEVRIPSDPKALKPGSGKWHHMAFTYSAGEMQLRHYVNGRLQKLPGKAGVTALEAGDEDYMTIGRDSRWKRPLQGMIDELRF